MAGNVGVNSSYPLRFGMIAALRPGCSVKESNLIMAQVRPLRNPPIIEAVIDFRVQYSRQTAAADFEQFHELISADYPGSKTRQGVEVKIDLDGGKSEQLSILSGFLFSSADGTQVVQSKVDGFSFSRLKPYQDWDTMFREAWRLWVAYRNRFSPDRIIRLSTRFINSTVLLN